MITSFGISACFRSLPTGSPGGSDQSPSWSSPRPSSARLSNIPSERTPRTCAAVRGVARSGSDEPIGAKGASMPTITLGAPHTTCNRASPTSTSHSRSRSASGWGATAVTRATTTPENAISSGSVASTSRPASVSTAARPAVSRGGSTWLRSQVSLIFMGP